MVAVIAALCWVAFGVTWIAGAAYNSRHAPAASARKGWVPSDLGAVIVAWVILQLLPVDWSSVVVHGLWIRALGVGVLVPSTAFTLWARVVLGTMWSSSPTAKEDHVLRTDGPYAVTRHPVYTGMLGMLTGTALAAGLGRWIPLLVVGVVVMQYKIRAEEQLLTEVFPAEYPRFREEVPRLIPGLRRSREERGS